MGAARQALPFHPPSLGKLCTRKEARSLAAHRVLPGASATAPMHRRTAVDHVHLHPACCPSAAGGLPDATRAPWARASLAGASAPSPADPRAASLLPCLPAGCPTSPTHFDTLTPTARVRLQGRAAWCAAFFAAPAQPSRASRQCARCRWRPGHGPPAPDADVAQAACLAGCAFRPMRLSC